MLNDDIAPRYLTGKLLIATPALSDGLFARSVIYMCAHTDEAAMGLVINRSFGAITFPDLLDQLGIESTVTTTGMPVHFGGPVESGRGFVLHSTEFEREGTLRVSDDVALTATLDILRAIAEGQGPRRSLLALGYAQWGPGQLDAEIQSNSWLHAEADESLVFDPDIDHKWEHVLTRIAGPPSNLSVQAGHA